MHSRCTQKLLGMEERRAALPCLLAVHTGGPMPVDVLARVLPARTGTSTPEAVMPGLTLETQFMPLPLSPRTSPCPQSLCLTWLPGPCPCPAAAAMLSMPCPGAAVEVAETKPLTLTLILTLHPDPKP